MNPACSISMCEDVLIEILSRLPAKTLVRFTSVCRRWKTIITSPQFMLATNRPNRLLVHTKRECYAVVEDEVVFEADLPLRHLSFDSAVVIGSDNGLICIAICSSSPTRHRSFIVWNPSIRRHVVVPDHLQDGKFIIYSTGFGATNSGLDYKLVRIVGYIGGGTEQKAFHIYSLKSGTWRRFDLDYESYLLGKMGFSRSPALLRGRLHWVVNQSSCLYISTLDLEDEVFENKAMMLPQQLPTASTDYLFKQHVITVIKESLAVIAFESGRKSTTSVWVMKEYGDVGSWVKWCSIDLTIGIFNVMHLFEMVGVLKNGNLLLRLLGWGFPSKLVTWDPKTMKTNDFGGGTGVLLSPLEVCGFTNYYKESLVLLADYEDRAVSDHKF